MAEKEMVVVHVEDEKGERVAVYKTEVPGDFEAGWRFVNTLGEKFPQAVDFHHMNAQEAEKVKIVK